jgi:hypothetical protein
VTWPKWFSTVSFHQQGQAIIETMSMGRIIDRTEEHLGTSDVMVIRAGGARSMRRKRSVTVGRSRPASTIRRSTCAGPAA